MNRKMFFLTIAAVSGLAAQVAESRMLANVPFPFDFQGTPMDPGRYEFSRSAFPKMLTIRNVTTGATLCLLTAGISQMSVTSNSLTFEKAGGRYYFWSMADARTALVYNANRSRKQMEAARNTVVEKVIIAAR